MEFSDEESGAMTVVGLELRTSNADAFETIPAHWQQFSQQEVLDQIPGKLSDDVFAVYTHFSDEGRSNAGTYSLVVGAQVAAGSQVPAGLAGVTLAPQRRKVVSVEKGRPDQVAAKWQEIWQTDNLGNTYLADYERYQASGEIDIFIGVM